MTISRALWSSPWKPSFADTPTFKRLATWSRNFRYEFYVYVMYVAKEVNISLISLLFLCLFLCVLYIYLFLRLCGSQVSHLPVKCGEK